MRVTANEFWEEYKQQIGVQTKVRYRNSCRWTEVTRDAAIRTLRAPPGSLYTSTEYLRVDVIGYDSSGTHDWRLRVAFEHENSSKTWRDELCKLCHVVADLRVLASYHGFSATQELVDELEGAVNALGDRITRVPDVEWLFIFGPWIKGRLEGPPFLAFTLDGTKVTQLLPDPRPLDPFGWCEGTI